MRLGDREWVPLGPWARAAVVMSVAGLAAAGTALVRSTNAGACASHDAVTLDPVAPTEQSCGVVAGARWSVGSRTGRTWAVYTDLPSCDTALRLVPQLTEESVVGIAAIGAFRCTSKAARGDEVLSGICYRNGPAAGYFAWGATVPAYEHPTPCGACTGDPNEHVATPLGGRRP
jgi:hypothetical protein